MTKKISDKINANNDLSAIAIAPGQVIHGVDENGNSASYEIKKFLGEGWTAVVYLGVNSNNPKQLAAVKVLRPNSDKLTEENFRSEKNILAQIRSQGIICVPEVYGLYNKEQPLEFIAMELVPETEYPRLDHILDLQGCLDEGAVLEIALQAATLLDNLHTKVNRTYTDMQLKDFCWNAAQQKLMVIDWNHVSFERDFIEKEKDNNPSVKQQLQARGAQDFNGLVQLDVRRFVTYIYSLLTGKQVWEVGETSWGLKSRAGGHWETMSESIRLIIFKALVAYPGVKPYQSAAELLTDIESAIALSKRNDIDDIADELVDILDKIDEEDESVGSDEKLTQWAPQRLQQINYARSLLSQIRKLPASSDPIMQKRLGRYEERINVLFDEVPPSWATGQRYFDLEQYLTALDLWQPLAEKRRTVHLWRQVLLAKAASENSNFAQMKSYLESALQDLKAGGDKIDMALQQFKSGIAVLQKMPDTGALAELQAEIEALQKVKASAEARSFGEKERNLFEAAKILESSTIPYGEILLHDPVWFEYVGPWLSEKESQEFETTGRSDVAEIINTQKELLEQRENNRLDQINNLSKNKRFVWELLLDLPKNIKTFQDRLWAQPDDETLFAAICQVFDALPKFRGIIGELQSTGQSSDADKNIQEHRHELLSQLKEISEGFIDAVDIYNEHVQVRLQQLEATLNPSFKRIFSLVLKWGAPTAETESQLRANLRTLNIAIYTNELNNAVNKRFWHSAEQAARMLVLLQGEVVKESDIVNRLISDFNTQSKSVENEVLDDKSIWIVLDPRIEYLIGLDGVLSVLNTPDVGGNRWRLMNAIADKRAKVAEIERGLRKQGNDLKKWKDDLQLSDQSIALKREFLSRVSIKLTEYNDPIFLNYTPVITEIDGHIQEIQDLFKKKKREIHSDIAMWVDSWSNYKKNLEADMEQQKLFAEYKQEIRNCVMAISRWDVPTANTSLESAGSKKDGLSSEYKVLVVLGDGDLANVCSSLSENNTKFESLKSSVNNFEFDNDEKDAKELQELREQCDELLNMQFEHAGIFAEIFPQFAYSGVNALDRQIANLETRLSVLLAMQFKPDNSTANDISVPDPVFHENAGGETHFHDGTMGAVNKTAGKTSLGNQPDPTKKKEDEPSKGFLANPLVKIIAGILALAFVVLLGGFVWLNAKNAASAEAQLATSIAGTSIAQAQTSVAQTSVAQTSVAQTSVAQTSVVVSIENFTPTPTVTFTPEVLKFTGIVNNPNGINLRFYPDTLDKYLIKNIPYNETFSIIGVMDIPNNEWYLVVYDNFCAWGSKKYITSNIEIGIPKIDAPYDVTASTPPSCAPSPTATPSLTETPEN